jgi:hypothetical protein
MTELTLTRADGPAAAQRSGLILWRIHAAGTEMDAATLLQSDTSLRGYSKASGTRARSLAPMEASSEGDLSPSNLLLGEGICNLICA